MTIYTAGSLNTTALIVPDLAIVILSPNVSQINGVPTNIVGIVGTATWGPVGAPTIVGNMAGYAAQFGAIQARLYDMGTAVAAAVLQGANNFRCVRVTDGTDVAAAGGFNGAAVLTATVVSGGTSGYAVNDTITLTGGTFSQACVLTVTSVASGVVTGVSITTPGAYTVLPTNPVAKGSTSGSGVGTPTFNLSFALITFTSKYTGTLANTDTVTIATGSAASSYKVTVLRAGQTPEVFDNITGSGATLWANMALAVNNGTSGLRGPSVYVTATSGGGSATPTVGSVTLAGGVDGVSSVSGTTLVGSDTIPRTGMYALRGTGASIAMLTDCSTSSTWTTQVAYGLSEGTYMIMVGPAGDTISNAISVLSGAGIDSYAGKLLFGDWCYFLDLTNNQTRLISPQGFITGLLGNLSPQNSSLNKQLYGIVATQKSASNSVYASADLAALGAARIDIITNPVPGGQYYGARFGHNLSSNPVIHQDTYTRLTNYIAASLNAALGVYIGMNQTPAVQLQAKNSILSFLQNLWSQNMIGNSNGTTPFSVTLDSTNNPQNRVALGIMQCDVSIQYLSVIEFFVVNVTAGQSVTVNRTQTQVNVSN